MSSEPRSDYVPPQVDSHHHLWDLSRLEYGWMPPPPNVLAQNYLPEDLAPALKRNLVSKTVLVQAHTSVEEATWMLDLADANEFIAGVVAWVDLTSPQVGRYLDELAKRPQLVGFRPPVHDEPDDDWIVRTDVIAGLKEVARHDLAFDLLFRPQHLKHAATIAEKVPGLRMVLDHIGKPLIADGVMEPWATDIAAVADIPGVHCKVSGMVTEADHDNWKVDDLRPYVTHVIEQFGYDRVMWGSDWPVCLLASSYDDVRESAMTAIGDCSHEEWSKLMGGNAIDFYRLS